MKMTQTILIPVKMKVLVKLIFLMTLLKNYQVTVTVIIQSKCTTAIHDVLYVLLSCSILSQHKYIIFEDSLLCFF